MHTPETGVPCNNMNRWITIASRQMYRMPTKMGIVNISRIWWNSIVKCLCALHAQICPRFISLLFGSVCCCSVFIGLHLTCTRDMQFRLHCISLPAAVIQRPGTLASSLVDVARATFFFCRSHTFTLWNYLLFDFIHAILNISLRFSCSFSFPVGSLSHQTWIEIGYWTAYRVQCIWVCV